MCVHLFPAAVLVPYPIRCIQVRKRYHHPRFPLWRAHFRLCTLYIVSSNGFISPVQWLPGPPKRTHSFRVRQCLLHPLRRRVSGTQTHTMKGSIFRPQLVKQKEQYRIFSSANAFGASFAVFWARALMAYSAAHPEFSVSVPVLVWVVCGPDVGA